MPSSATTTTPDAQGAPAVELRVEQLGKSFGEKVVLKDINLTVHAGEIVAIVGGSGSGKTVLLDQIVGLIKPTTGRVRAADHNAWTSDGPPLVDITAMDEDALDLIRLHWAVVFQRNALFSGSVRDNLSLWLREHTDLKEKEIDKRIRKALAAAALDVNDVINKDRDSLSGGMAKRVAIARAVACDPIVMFYDEPTTGLDPVTGGQIHELIFATHQSPVGPGFKFHDLPSDVPERRPGTKRTTVIVTHDRELLRRVEPRVIMLHESKVCFDGPYAKFGGPECPPAQQYLASMPVLQGRM